MNHSNFKSFIFATTWIVLLAGASCSSEKKPEPNDASDGATTSVATQPGVAGGVAEDTFTASATVQAIDASTRKVTLRGEDGKDASFIAPPEVRNFDQLRVGDKVNATFTERLHVFVRRDGADPSLTHAAALAAAPKGAKPGAMVAETYEIVASVKEIDSATRTVKLQFSDGQTRTVTPRADVNLSRYKVGDSVVIRVTESLSVLVEQP